MKFLTPGEQRSVLLNSYNALADGGLAMHIIHAPSIDGTEELKNWQYRVNPDKLLDQLRAKNIPAAKLAFNSASDVPWLKPTTALIINTPALL